MRLQFLLLLMFLHQALSKSINPPNSKEDAVTGCNLNLCFVLDSSAFVSAEDYVMQTDFVLDVLALIAGNDLEVAVGQFGRRVTPISLLTPDVASVVLAVDESEPLGDRFGRVARALRWCHGVLKARRGEAGKIVVLTNGRGLRRPPQRIARRIRRQGYEICTVGVNVKNPRRLLQVSGVERLVFDVEEYLELTDVVEDVVEAVCGTELLR